MSEKKQAVIPEHVPLDKAQLDLLNTPMQLRGYNFALGCQMMSDPSPNFSDYIKGRMEVSERCFREGVETDDEWDFGWYVGRLEKLRGL